MAKAKPDTSFNFGANVPAASSFGRAKPKGKRKSARKAAAAYARGGRK